MRHKIIQHQKKKWYQPIIALALMAFIIWMSSTLYHSLIKYRDAKTSADITRTELKDLEKKHQMLTEKIEYLSTDFGFDQEIKTQYRIAKPGEDILVIIDNTPEDIPEEDDNHSWVQKIRLFIGL